MFLSSTLRRNKELIEASFMLHQTGQILPDTYVIDLDTLKKNAMQMLDAAKKQNISLYFMLKQLGRNPLIAKELVKLGYEGAVVVDFKEAKVMMKHHIPIANVGHLVQAPKAMIQELVNYGCHYFTIFSIDKAREISECANAIGIKQKVLLKVVGPEDMIYSGQTAGFRLAGLDADIEALKCLDGIEIAGVTSFPCFLFNEEKDTIAPTPNMDTLLKAKEILEKHGIQIENVNAPSATCTFTLDQMKGYPINSGEPGHGLSGTTPLHAYKECVEVPCVTYVSEISHNFDERSYCYGGGFYRRSHVAHTLVGKSMEDACEIHVEPPSLESIDYYFELDKECMVSDTVIMAFRFQIFVTRSHVAVVEGIHEGKMKLLGIYNSLGDEIQ